jgi:hypothetical protein
VHTEYPGGIVKVKLVDPMPLHSTLCYPGTSQPLRAVAVRTDGTPVWPLLGSDGEEDEGGEGEGSDDEGDPEESEDSDEESEDDGVKGKSRKKSGPVSREEFDRVRRHLSLSDAKKAAAEKELADLKKFKEEHERKGNTELQNLQKDHGDLVKDHEKLQGRFQKMARTNAFLTASAQEKITWHDPVVAQRSADLDELEIDENGNVEGIREAVKALAKKHKYLVNSGSGDDEDGEDKPPVRRGASGSGVGSTKTSKGKANKGQLSEEELRKRFPALNRR